MAQDLTKWLNWLELSRRCSTTQDIVQCTDKTGLARSGDTCFRDISWCQPQIHRSFRMLKPAFSGWGSAPDFREPARETFCARKGLCGHGGRPGPAISIPPTAYHRHDAAIHGYQGLSDAFRTSLSLSLTRSGLILSRNSLPLDAEAFGFGLYHGYRTRRGQTFGILEPMTVQFHTAQLNNSAMQTGSGQKYAPSPVTAVFEAMSSTY